MAAKGGFTPTGESVQKFTVYFDAEIEKELATALRVPEDAAVIVDLDPSTRFGQGTLVMNLAALDGRTLEFRDEMVRGTRVKRNDDRLHPPTMFTRGGPKWAAPRLFAPASAEHT